MQKLTNLKMGGRVKFAFLAGVFNRLKTQPSPTVSITIANGKHYHFK
jgi:hypothetical protein